MHGIVTNTVAVSSDGERENVDDVKNSVTITFPLIPQENYDKVGNAISCGTNN